MTAARVAHGVRGLLVAGLLAPSLVRAAAQASAIPSAQAGPETRPDSAEGGKGRTLMGEMVAALGGDAWLNRTDWFFTGRSATFYKGQPHEEAPQYEEYFRAKPFGERIVVITHSGIFIATNHKDIAVVWTPDNGYELTFKGKNPLPADEVADYQRRRAHSLETVVQQWLARPDTLVTYEGTNMVNRRLAEQVSIVTAQNDAVTLELQESTHLPLSLGFQWRDPLYKDFNTDEVQWDDYHPVQGIETPYAWTYLHNGDVTRQRFLTKAFYNQDLPAKLFDPDEPLTVKEQKQKR